jgi:hypothetical protein
MKLPFINVGSMCVDCGKDTAMGSGLFVDRIGSDKIWSINDRFEIEVDGYLCRDCQLLDCDKCGTGVLYYELIDNSVICENCLEGNND